jgi:hypothetical protein
MTTVHLVGFFYLLLSSLMHGTMNLKFQLGSSAPGRRSIKNMCIKLVIV